MAIKNIKDVTQFNNVLNTYVSQRNSAMNNLLALSQFGIKHLQECGDLGPLQRLHDAMKKGYENRNGLARWICAYTPTVFEASKFPIPDVLNIFAADEVKSAMEKIVARFQNEKKNKALNENATEAVTKLSKLIESM